MKMNRLTALFLVLVLFTGCAFLQGPQSKAKPKRKTGTTVRAEKWMRVSIDSELAREKRGERPSSGKKTWREYWQWRISLWRKQKHQKYEQYFVQRRKELGLKKISAL
jgi:hypothetical protein